MPVEMPHPSSPAGAVWASYARRYATGEYRAQVCRDIVLNEVAEGSRPTMLDIGCGRGFLDDSRLQKSLAERSGEYIGIEPDSGIEAGDWIAHVHRTLLEDAPIPAQSIDLAFSAMVLEHLPDPALFFDKLFDILRPGGVFWGFTVDSRNWFVKASLATERLGLKKIYLQALRGANEDDYKNYPVHYRANSPRQLQPLTSRFASSEVFNLSRVGDMDYYFPHRLRWIGRMLDRAGNAAGSPGVMLAVRLQR